MNSLTVVPSIDGLLSEVRTHPRPAPPPFTRWHWTQPPYHPIPSSGPPSWCGRTPTVTDVQENEKRRRKGSRLGTRVVRASSFTDVYRCVTGLERSCGRALNSAAERTKQKQRFEADSFDAAGARICRAPLCTKRGVSTIDGKEGDVANRLERGGETALVLFVYLRGETAWKQRRSRP